MKRVSGVKKLAAARVIARAFRGTVNLGVRPTESYGGVSLVVGLKTSKPANRINLAFPIKLREKQGEMD